MIGPLPAIAPSAELDVVLQGAAVGALFGSGVVAWFEWREPHANTWRLTAAGTLLGAAVALLIVAARRLSLL